MIEQKANELGRFLTRKASRLDFEEPTPTLDRPDDRELRPKILGLTASQARQLRIGKGSLHYLREKSRSDRFLKLYDGTRGKLATLSVHT